MPSRVVVYLPHVLLRVEEVAERLRVQPATVYRFIRDGLLPCIRFGRMVRIREADLEVFGTSHHGSGTSPNPRLAARQTPARAGAR